MKNITEIENKLANYSNILFLLFNILQVILPIVLALYISKDYEWKLFSIPTLIIIFTALCAILNFWHSCLNKDFLIDILAFRSKEKIFLEKEKLNKIIALNIYKNVALTTILARLETTVLRHKAVSDNKTEIFENLVYSLYDHLNHIKETGEIYTVALYLYDENSTLKDFVSKKPHYIGRGEKDDKGRDWSILSESHISHTFRIKETQVFYDIQDFLPGLEKEKLKKYDFETYRASIAIPLKYENSEKVRGVFCITSNIPGAFSNENIDNDSHKNLINQRQSLITMFSFFLEYLLNKYSPASNLNILSNNNQKEQSLENKNINM